jgi:parallel beta-helix repeat protein
MNIMSMDAKNTVRPLPASRENWLYVGGTGPGNYTKIQDAIDNASDGDTVFVFHGTYTGYVLINKSISLVGEEKNTTIITGYVAYTVSILSDWVTMSGFTIKNGGGRGEGVRIDSSFNTFVSNIVVIPNDDLRIFGNDNTIVGNTITGDQIFLSGERNTISNNTITNNDNGILFVDSWDNIISNNSFIDSGVFISDEIARNNNIINNTVNDKPLVYLYDESNVVLDADAGQILLINCTNITIQDQEISNTSVGIQLLGSNSCIISGSTLKGNQYGIYLSGLNNTINDCTIINNNVAVRLFGDDNTISKNIISNNVAGFYLNYCTKSTISNNTFTNNEYSINLDYGSNKNSIINNTIVHNRESISLTGDQNTIAGNTITNNDNEGIYLIFSNYNTIFNNIITNNDDIGVLLAFSNYNTINHNTITNNHADGINIDFGACNTIIDNTVTNNSHDGIHLFGDNNTCSANTINNNTDGISLVEHGYNTITGNTISRNNRSGMYLNHSSGNTLSGNRISKNRQGISLVSSSNNTVLNNTFLRNTQQALFENCTNKWDRNYWGRPRILPKLIFGTIEIKSKEVPWLNIDWHPALKPQGFIE